MNKTVKLVITVSSLAVVFLALSISSAFYNVSKTKKAINNIGEIKVENLSLDSAKKRLDEALNSYNKLDRNLKLETKITNIDTLNEKEKEFVNVSILLAKAIDQQKVKLNLSNADVAKYILAVDEYKKAYISDEDFSSLSNYSKYQTLEEKYKDYLSGSGENTSSNTSGGQAEEIEIC